MLNLRYIKVNRDFLFTHCRISSETGSAVCTRLFGVQCEFEMHKSGFYDYVYKINIDDEKLILLLLKYNSDVTLFSNSKNST